MSYFKEKQEPKYDVPAGTVPVFQTAICDCPDISASTMAVDATGRYAIISGRKSMGLIDLDGNNADNNADLSATTSQTISSPASTVAELGNSIKQGPTCKRFVRNSKYEPTSSHFNRHLVDLYALSTYQVVEIFSIEEAGSMEPRLTLRGHSRAIADIEWSYFDSHLLGSAAADCSTNLWDIRDPRRPSTCLTSVSGATQVRFCKTSSNLIATSHEIDVRIWDIRQPNLPVNYIAAHLQKINGMDWSTSKHGCDHEQLITCSQDNTIKLWDLTTSKTRPSANLPTRTPAWRIRYTPVSPYAILTSTLPQLRSRAECMNLKLWSMKSSRFEQKNLKLCLCLVGHSDVIIDFDWRNQAQSSGACEIVSWSKDQTLRVWRVDNQFIEMNVDNSDYEADCDTQTSIDHSHGAADQLASDESLILKAPKSPLYYKRHLQGVSSIGQSSSYGSHQVKLKTSEQVDNQKDDESETDESSIVENSTTTNELEQEINLINKNIPNIEFEELNSLRRVCLVTARTKNITCRLRIALPPNYPHNEFPTFTIIESNQYGADGLNKDAKEKLISLLNETAKAQLTRSHNCIETCLRKFIAALQKITSHLAYRRRGLGSSIGGDYKDDPITLSAQRDHSVPFPPTSGARFCGNLLVCFGRPLLPTINNTSSTRGSSGDSTSYSVETPRSMAQLSAQLDNMRRQGSYNLSNISISYFYYGAMRRAELQSRTSLSSQRASMSSGITSRGTSSSSSKYLTGRSRTNALGAHSMLAKNFKCGPVIVYDVSNLLGEISKELAEDYVFDKDVIKMCRRNSEIAASHNRRDLVQIWSLAELSSEGVLRSYVPNPALKNQENEDCLPMMSLMNSDDSDFGDRPWTMHPFGSKLIQSLIDHYVYNCHDVQTAAMLVWTFSSPKLGRQTKEGQHSIRLTSSTSTSSTSHATRTGKTYSEVLSSGSNKLITNSLQVTGGSNVSTTTIATGNLAANERQAGGVVHTNDTISNEWSFVNGPEAHSCSNSWSNSTNNMIEDASWVENKSDKTSIALAVHGSNQSGPNQGCGADQTFSSQNYLGLLEQRCFPKLNILSPDKSLQNDLILHIYAELLYRLNLLNQRAMVLKNIGSNSAYSEIFGDKQMPPNDTPQDRLSNLTVVCSNSRCPNKCRSVQCGDCKKFSFYCSICRLPVRGSCSICLNCLHGGHVNHFSAWFNTHDFCPTGCGCKCPTVLQG